jgi:hypothetical protein
MNEKIPSQLTGLLTMDRLFVGSKSEGHYPVLHTDDGKRYRLHNKVDFSLNEKTLSNYDRKRVQVVGTADNDRGHWRFVLVPGSLPLVLDGASSETFAVVLEKTTDLTQLGSSASTKGLTGTESGESEDEPTAIAQDPVPAVSDAVDNRIKE